MDFIFSVMSSGTCFAEEHVRRWHRLPTGINSDPPCYIRNHATSFPAQPEIYDQIAKADRVIVPVRDPVLSCITGMRKGENARLISWRIRGWRAILELEDPKFKFLPIDIHEPLRSQYASKVFPGMMMTWDDVVNSHKDAQNKFNYVRDQYVMEGVFPSLPHPADLEWEQARDQLQSFLERLGYNPLSWWR